MCTCVFVTENGMHVQVDALELFAAYMRTQTQDSEAQLFGKTRRASTFASQLFSATLSFSVLVVVGAVLLITGNQQPYLPPC